MTDSDTELQKIKIWLGSEAVDKNLPDFITVFNYLVGVATLFVGADEEKQRAMISKFHNCAGRLPYYKDRDIGALILEQAADVVTDNRVRKFLYSEARLRALWCAQSATSGGEGLSRSSHIQELDNKFSQ